MIGVTFKRFPVTEIAQAVTILQVANCLRMKTKLMNTLNEYFDDELTGWSRVLDLHKEESESMVRKLTFLTGRHAGYDKESESYRNQLLVQEQHIGYLKILINNQRLLFARSGKSGMPSISAQQDVLRTKMHAEEKNFTRIKYGCTFFLFSSLALEEDEHKLALGS